MIYLAKVLVIAFILILIYTIYIFLIYKLKANNSRIMLVLNRFKRISKVNNYLLKDPKRIKYLFLICGIYSLLFITIIINKLILISLILLIILTMATMIAYVHDTLSNKNVKIKIIGMLFMYGYIILYGFGLVGIVAKNAANQKTVIIGILTFIIITLSSLWSSVVYLENNLYKFIVIISCYFLLIFFGSWVFGLYYLCNNYWNKEVVNLFNSSISSWKILWLLSKYTLVYFYNCPSCGSFVEVLQYFIGKFLDLFLLGYIFNIVFDMSRKSSPKSQI